MQGQTFVVRATSKSPIPTHKTDDNPVRSTLQFSEGWVLYIMCCTNFTGPRST